MKPGIQLLTAIFLTSILSTSCMFSGSSINGNGDVQSENREMGDFNEIKVSRGMNVYVAQGNETKVVVKADENLLGVIETKLEDRTLKIRATRNIRKATVRKVFVTTPGINLIQSSSGSNVYSETVLRGDHLDISSSSGSNMKLLISVNELSASSSSGSNINLEGRADSFEGNASSGSNIKARELMSKNCEVGVSSGANIWISVKDNLKASASSGGNIFYQGNLSNAEINKSSGGNVKKRVGGTVTLKIMSRLLNNHIKKEIG